MSICMCLCRSLKLILGVLILTACFTGTVFSEDGFGETIQRLNQSAQRAKDKGDFEQVEKIRRERWALIREHAEGGKHNDSPWVAAYRAIELVDGSESGAADAVATGLLNELRYKEACDTLWRAFRAMQASSKGPLLGEVAVRFFEVSQQALGVYYDALDPSNDKRVADLENVTEALTVARERDPCCVLATPMLHYLKAPDPKEAFIRAEVRPAFKQRQKELVEISHPFVINEGDDKATNPEKPATKNEHDDVAVMPWHAPVEIDKARSLQHLLDDLDYTYPLLPDWVSKDDYFFGEYSIKDVPNYIIPGAIFKGTDAFSQPLMLVFGQIFFGRKADETGRLRTVAFFQDRGAVQSKKRMWDHQYLEILWRVPSDEELSQDPQLRQRHELVARHPVRRKFALGKQEFYIFDFPVRETGRFIELGVQVVCLRDITRLEKLTFTPTGNRPDAISKLLTKPEVLERSPFSTSPFIHLYLTYLEFRNDPTKHSLTELTRASALNPLVVVSEKHPTDKDRSGPSLWPADRPDGFPYIKLDDGIKLNVAIKGRPEAPCCWIEFPGATAFMPLTPRAIPQGLLLGSKQGKACVSLLNDAGYSDEEAAREILACMEKPDSYVPSKFKTFLSARVNARIKQLQAELAKRGQRAPPPTRDQMEQWAWRVFGEMLEEKGWEGSLSLANSMHEAFKTYGFRYLRDLRGNWIMPSSLIEGASRAEEQSPCPFSVYPFAFLAQDGEKRIESSQIYSWAEYQAIKRNIFQEHLRKAIVFHPSLAMLEVIADNDSSRLLHPEERKPQYLKESFKRVEQLNSPGQDNPCQPSEKRTIHYLESPIAAWATGSDVAQQRSLTHLANAYTKCLVDYTNSGFEAARIVSLLQLINSYLYVFLDDKEFFSKLLTFRDKLSDDLRKAIEKDGKVHDTVLGIQLNSARDYAKRRYYHKAITYYNDLLGKLSADGAMSPRLELFASIPTSETANTFVGDVEKAIAHQWLLINAQMELAGVLNAAGLASSAQFIWQRTIDEYDFFLSPATGVAEGLLESYGLRPSGRMKNVGQRLEDAVNECRGAIERYCADYDWRHGILAGGGAKLDRDVSQSVVELRALLEQDNAGLLDDESQASIDHTLAIVTKKCVLTFQDWLELKHLLLELRPVLAKLPVGSSTPLAGCPQRYIPDPEKGFCDQVDDFLRETRSDEVINWCKLPIDAANRDASAARISFLIAWYYSDMGRVPDVRAALVNVARVESARAKEAGSVLDRLVHERNAFSAIVEAGENTQIFPGFSAFKTDFSQLLQGQLGDWEKRWFASGHYGPHASEFRYDLEARDIVIKNDLSRLSRKWRRNRWFFPDYTFKFGSVPDYLVVKLMNTPELFRELTADEVKNLGGEAVEGKRWALLSEPSADEFLKSFRLDDTLKKDILYLKP